MKSRQDVFCWFVKRSKEARYHDVCANVKRQILLSVPQKWRQNTYLTSIHTQRERNPVDTAQKETDFSGGREINGEAFIAAGHTAPLYIIKLPEERPFSLTILTNRPPLDTPGRLVARLLWEESDTKVAPSLFNKGLFSPNSECTYNNMKGRANTHGLCIKETKTEIRI